MTRTASTTEARSTRRSVMLACPQSGMSALAAGQPRMRQSVSTQRTATRSASTRSIRTLSLWHAQDVQVSEKPQAGSHLDERNLPVYPVNLPAFGGVSPAVPV